MINFVKLCIKKDIHINYFEQKLLNKHKIYQIIKYFNFINKIQYQINLPMKNNLQNIKPLAKQKIINRTQKNQNTGTIKSEFLIKKVMDKKKSKIFEYCGVLEQKGINQPYNCKIHSKRQQSNKRIQNLPIKIAVNKIKLQKRQKKSQEKIDNISQIQILKKEVEYLQSDSERQDEKSIRKNNTKFPKRQEIYPVIETPFKDLQRLSNNFFFSKEKMSVILQNRRRIKKLKSFSFPNQKKYLNTLNKQICLNDILTNTRPYSSINDETYLDKDKKSDNFLNFTNYIQNYHVKNDTKFANRKSNDKNKKNNRDDLRTTFYSAEIRNAAAHNNNWTNEHDIKSRNRNLKIL